MVNYISKFCVIVVTCPCFGQLGGSVLQRFEVIGTIALPFPVVIRLMFVTVAFLCRVNGKLMYPAFTNG